MVLAFSKTIAVFAAATLAILVLPSSVAHFPGIDCTEQSCDVPPLDTSGCNPNEIGCLVMAVIDWVRLVTRTQIINLALFVVSHCVEHAKATEACA